ncbi:MAG: hypothetical protein CMJ58_04290 [Planctomycetaceae bacterium]|nr:hypothetical protein [Planctomycetaceae bacterium]
MAPACLFAAFLLALIAGLALTPVVIRIALRLNAIDAPDGGRKHQASAVPLGGGLTVAACTAVGALTILTCSPPVASAGNQSLLLTGLISAAAVLLVVGLIDDFVGLTGIYKLVGQVLAATMLAAGGTQFHSLSLLGLPFELGSFALPFSVFFILGAVNAFNLIDGSDGLAGSIGIVVLLTLGTISAAQGNALLATISFAAAGAVAGFLPYNWAPARIYLGDTGSMLIGLIVAFVAVESSIKQQAAAALAVPIAVCAIPILDVVAALVRRITTGQSVFTPDRGHLHHALLLKGLSVGQTALLAAGLTAVTCVGALASYYFRQDWPAMVSVAFVIGGLASLRIFGHAEARLVATHARTGWGGLWRRVRRNAVVGGQTDHAIPIQGSREWDDLWTAMRESAPKYGICSLRLNVNIPRLHEAFYGNWRLRDAPGKSSDEPWRLVMPLYCGGQAVGKLTLAGRPGSQEGPDLEMLAAYMQPLQDQMQQIVNRLSPAEKPSAADTPSSSTKSAGPAGAKSGSQHLAAGV